MNSVLVGGVNDPNILALQPYFNNFVDIKSDISWDLNKDYITVNNKKLNIDSLFIRYDAFETVESINIKQNCNFSLVWNYLQCYKKIKRYNRFYCDRPIQKLTNLILAKRLGLIIPNTDYSIGDGINNKILKPIDGGAHAVVGLSAAYDCIVQDRIIGENKRLYIINDKHFCFKLNTTMIDYRNDDNTTIELSSISEDTIDKSFKLAKKVNLNFCALDFMTNEKEYFLEINTGPMFSEFSKITNNVLAKTIAMELI